MDGGVDRIVVPMTWRAWWAAVKDLVNAGYTVVPPSHLARVDGPRPEYTRPRAATQ